MIFAVLLLVASYVLLIVVVVRCADGRIGINGVAGIRTATIMANEETWLAGVLFGASRGTKAAWQILAKQQPESST
jgi:hypothetical protein